MVTSIEVDTGEIDEHSEEEEILFCSSRDIGVQTHHNARFHLDRRK